jgi:regulator of protease activity HflC (stomatin/prohibitin superfamily)
MQRQPPPANLGGTYNLSFYALAAGILLAVVSKYSVHQVPEGHVGVYWRGGKLLPTVTDPGLHFKLPLLDVHAPIQVTLQTDKVTNIPCGTKGGVMIYFEKVEVVNRLKKSYVHETIQEYGIHYDKTWIYDKIHHEINQFCSGHSLQEVYVDQFDQVDERMKEALQQDCTRYAPGIEIIAVRVTKPRIPDIIMQNYEAMEEQRTKVLVATERQRVMSKEAEIELKQAIAEVMYLHRVCWCVPVVSATLTWRP